jgi:hypothetical protein
MTPMLSSGDAMVNWIDPSGYPPGTEISNGWAPAVTLSTLGALLPNVYAVMSPISQTVVFGYDNGFGPTTGWGFVGALRADFAGGATEVSLYYGAMGFSGSIVLSAFDAGLGLLGTDMVSGFIDGQGFLTVSYPNIAFVQGAYIGGGEGSDFLRLSYTPVPEPSTLALFALGGGALLWARRPRRQPRR